MLDSEQKLFWHPRKPARRCCSSDPRRKGNERFSPRDMIIPPGRRWKPGRDRMYGAADIGLDNCWLVHISFPMKEALCLARVKAVGQWGGEPV
eukprot:351138-Chlamydomonas_euryale.AAC.7